MTNTILHGDCIEKIRELPDNSVDSVVTDPPYELGFMGKSWDNTGIANSKEMWAEALRVLKPGGHLLAFSGTRTYHRMAVAIEDAGFEVRDMIEWIYSTGFPKSHNVWKQLKKECDCGIMDEYERTKKIPESLMRLMSETDISQTITNSKTEWEVLQSELSEQSISVERGLSKSLPLSERGTESSLERGSATETNPRELSRNDLSEMSEGISTNGEERRIHNATQISDGSTPEQTINENGSGASHRPQSEKQQDREPCAFCKQHGTQAIRTFGVGSALKPAHEPICFARKPLEKGLTIAENVLKYGTGGINIDISRISAYIDGDNSENIVLSHKLSELRGKLHTLLFSYEVGKKDCPIPSNDDGYVQKWKELQDCLGDCLACRGLYDELSPLFLKDDQVSVQQLHDALSRISHYQSKQSDTPCSQCKFRLSNLDDLNQLVLSYSNDTTLYIQKQELKTQKAKGSNGGEAYGDYNLDATYTPSTLGRFPANLIHDNSEEVRECFPETKDTHKNEVRKFVSKKRGNGFLDALTQEGEHITRKSITDSGSASRFFKSIIYQAKASKSERNKGCEELEEKSKVFNGQSNKPSKDMKDVEKRFTTLPKANNHPTVKPIALMSYLIKMVTPEGGVVLDPFAGSGSTLVAAKKNGYQYIGIEMTEEYIPIIEARLK